MPRNALDSASEDEQAFAFAFAGRGVALTHVAISNPQLPAVFVPKQINVTCPSHLCALVAELTAAFKVERTRGAELNNRQDVASFKRMNDRVNDLLKAYSLAGAGDWRSYAVWSEHSYLRHLLWATEEFELMLLCWRPGQTSRVHTHADSHCWFAVLDGQVRETKYPPLPTGKETPKSFPAAAGGAMDLAPTITADKAVGEVAYINDNIAMHSVGCVAGEGPEASDGHEAPMANKWREGVACTLHVYCPPIRRAKALEGGRMTDCIPGFFSRHSIYAE